MQVYYCPHKMNTGCLFAADDTDDIDEHVMLDHEDD